MSAGLRKALRVWVVSAAFALTGVAVALLGAALPAMLAEWHLSDRSGGWLLLSSFGASTLGALLIYGDLQRLAAGGLLASAVAAGYISGTHKLPLQPAFCLYGLGLGITMTAISTLRSREVYAQESHLEMNRLNLFWAIGACFAPAFALRSLRLVSVSTLFRSEALALCLLSLCLLAFGRSDMRTARDADARAGPRLPWLPLRICGFAAAAVALETAIGGWLATYAQRVSHGAGFAEWANSAFWVGLLLSRGAHSLRRSSRGGSSWGSSPTVTRLHLGAVVLAMSVLVAVPSEAVLPLAALAAGLGLGPLYPLALSIALPRYRSTPIFLATGLGAAALPWITGALSTAFGSLRAGLLAPCATVGFLLLAAALMRQELFRRGTLESGSAHNIHN